MRKGKEKVSGSEDNDHRLVTGNGKGEKDRREGRRRGRRRGRREGRKARTKQSTYLLVVDGGSGGDLAEDHDHAGLGAGLYVWREWWVVAIGGRGG